jgi:hypothetical protein
MAEGEKEKKGGGLLVREVRKKFLRPILTSLGSAAPDPTGMDTVFGCPESTWCLS